MGHLFAEQIQQELGNCDCTSNLKRWSYVRKKCDIQNPRMVKGQNMEIKPCTDEYNVKNFWKANIKMQRAFNKKKTDREDIWSPVEGFRRRLKCTSEDQICV